MSTTSQNIEKTEVEELLQLVACFPTLPRQVVLNIWNEYPAQMTLQEKVDMCVERLLMLQKFDSEPVVPVAQLSEEQLKAQLQQAQLEIENLKSANQKLKADYDALEQQKKKIEEEKIAAIKWAIEKIQERDLKIAEQAKLIHQHQQQQSGENLVRQQLEQIEGLKVELEQSNFHRAELEAMLLNSWQLLGEGAQRLSEHVKSGVTHVKDEFSRTEQEYRLVERIHQLSHVIKEKIKFLLIEKTPQVIDEFGQQVYTWGSTQIDQVKDFVEKSNTNNNSTNTSFNNDNNNNNNNNNENVEQTNEQQQIENQNQHQQEQNDEDDEELNRILQLSLVEK